MEDTVNRGEVIPGKLCAQFHKQRSLPRRQFPAVKVKPVRNLDAAAIPTAYRFDGVGTHENGNILPDGFSRNLKFKCQVAVCIVPPYAQHFQNRFPPFCIIHASTPFPLLSETNGIW